MRNRTIRMLQRGIYGKDVEHELAALAEKRRTALAEAESVVRRVEELLPHALDVGFTISSVADLSGVSRQTLHAHLRGKRATD